MSLDKPCGLIQGASRRASAFDTPKDVDREIRTPAPERVRPLNSVTQLQSERLARILEALNQLECQMRPILNPQGPCDPCGKPSEPQSIAEVINLNNITLDSIAGRIQALSDRLHV